MVKATYEELLETRVVFGSPESVIDRLTQFQEMLGITGITAELNPGGFLPKEAITEFETPGREGDARLHVKGCGAIIYGQLRLANGAYGRSCREAVGLSLRRRASVKPGYESVQIDRGGHSNGRHVEWSR